ncbi:MAG: hypothetical protein IT517_03955 [Burkholderiales bacterium]|nr:hypothetical protein [Burkholderiales bacterium]
MPIAGWVLAAALAASGAAHAQQPGVGWPSYGGDAGGTRYSRLAEIHAGNFARLAVAWEYRTGDHGALGRCGDTVVAFALPPR